MNYTPYILTGIIIFVLFVWPIIKAIKKAIRKRKENKIINYEYKLIKEKEKEEKKEK